MGSVAQPRPERKPVSTAKLIVVTGLQGSGKTTLANEMADALRTSVVSWDWLVAGLTKFPAIDKALRQMDTYDYRRVGWSLVWQMTTAELQAGRSVIVDGMAGDGEINEARLLAREHGAGCHVVLTTCDDLDLHRSRIEGRPRSNPGWNQLNWTAVAGARRQWSVPTDIDVTLDASDSPTAAKALGSLGVQAKQKGNGPKRLYDRLHRWAMD